MDRPARQAIARRIALGAIAAGALLALAAMELPAALITDAGTVLLGVAGFASWCVAIVAAAIVWWHRRRLRQSLDEPGGACIECGFPLRIESSTCSECGASMHAVDRSTVHASMRTWSAVDRVLSVFVVGAVVIVMAVAGLFLFGWSKRGLNDPEGARLALRTIGSATALSLCLVGLPLVLLVPRAWRHSPAR